MAAGDTTVRSIPCFFGSQSPSASCCSRANIDCDIKRFFNITLKVINLKKNLNHHYENYLDDSYYSYDYKYEWSKAEIINNFRSVEKWLYLGADAAKNSFAKIGMTMGDLSSRSYSSENPNYYLFCAFKCRHDLSRSELESIEKNVLLRMECLYRKADGSSTRLKHHDSKLLSECFDPVDFLAFFKSLHLEIYQSHRDNFVICGVDDGFGGCDGELVDCLFNPNINDRNKFMRMIIQY